MRKHVDTSQVFDTEKMSEICKFNFLNLVFTKEQPFAMDFSGFILALKVGSMKTLLNSSLVDCVYGILTEKTSIKFFPAPESNIHLAGPVMSSFNPNSILAPDFDFEELGIGGLKLEFATIFRRAFASRIMPLSVVKAMGAEHVKGVLLYGPPGTGKTLMARKIAKVLKSREPKIVNGPEILSKYVGQSEENIRNLFKDAEAEYKAKGDHSKLHVVIFDEIDAICRQRGSRSDNTGVGDSIVNQLLSKIDGVDQLNNVLIFGMTNRLDMIDEALLRPGRFEVQIEFGLPSEEGRLEIFKIHTAEMVKGQCLGKDVDLNELARRARNFTGAEIAGLVRSAQSFAMSRDIEIKTSEVKSTELDKIQVTMDNFICALEEVKAAYGISRSELTSCLTYDILSYNPIIGKIFNESMKAIRLVSGKTSGDKNSSTIMSMLLYGPKKSGKTAIAAKLALDSGFPFIRIIGPSTLGGKPLQAKLDALTTIFMDAYKSDLSLIIIDDLEWMLELNDLDLHYSMPVRQLLIALLKGNASPGHRLLIIGTGRSKKRLSRLGIQFDRTINIPIIKDFDSFEYVIMKSPISLNREDRLAIIESIASKDCRIKCGIGELLSILNFVEEEGEDIVGNFVSAFTRHLKGSKLLRLPELDLPKLQY